MRILIHHSWSPNMGDAAMLSSTASLLRSICPDCHICALVSHPEITKNACPGLDAELRGWPWPVPQRGRAGLAERLSYPFIWGSNMLSAAAYRLTGKKLFIGNGKYRPALEGFFASDVVLTPGGDFISPNYFYMTTFSEMLIAKLLGKKLVVLGQSTVPFRGLAGGLVARFVLGLPDLIIVRERHSAKWLGSIGVRNVHVTGDVAFLLGHRPSVERRDNRIAICPKGFADRESTARLARLAARLRAEGFGITVLLSDGHDERVQKELAGLMGDDAEFVSGLLGPEALADRIASCGFIISARMHAIILGTLSSTPFFALSDSFKFEHILEQFYPGCFMDHKALDAEGIERVVAMVRRRGELGPLMKERMGQVVEKSYASREILESNFRKWGLLKGTGN
ncbi:MAG TPA: polysaccharide pyruvyl transferase family protein [Candidatus Bilamarchaeum sp.]|nr:polysaccharide pyruvyl transferase family protein [Candidatus Bilamarchaeum sp.]